MQHHLGKAAAKVAHHLGQRITGLRMRGRNGQPPLLAGTEVLAGAAQVVGLEQQLFHDGHQAFARRRQAGEAFAGTHKNLHAQLLLQFANLAAHTGLRGVEHLRHFREIETPAHGFPHRAQLLKIHATDSASRNSS
ncbi:hypothetical protein D3C79_947240 [compost metagenome]